MSFFATVGDSNSLIFALIFCIKLLELKFGGQEMTGSMFICLVEGGVRKKIVFQSSRRFILKIFLPIQMILTGKNSK